MIKSLILGFYKKLLMRKFAKKGILIGEGTWVSYKAYIDSHSPAKVTIGENCFITRNVIILNHTDTRMGGPKNIWKEIGGERVFGDVVIGDNVFIGVGAVIMPGVKVGNNSIVGALSVVTKDVPDGKIVAGNPSRIIGDTMDHVKRNNK